MNDPEPAPSTADSRPEIALQNPNRYGGLDAPGLERWLRRLVGELAPGAAAVGVRLVGDRAMRRLNREFRGRDRTTDVLSFPGEVGGGEAGYLGDIAISLPVARRQARDRGRSLDTELKTLLLHGLLHCLGHDHETDGGEMARLEHRLRRRHVDHPPRTAVRDAG